MLRAMFIGHFGVGFASQRAAPRAPFTLLVAAPLFLDLLWPIFLLLGLESVRIDPGNTAFTPLDLHDYPYSHSLVGALVWSILFGSAYLLWRRESRGAWVLGAGVFSHWVLDFITHRPDMPLYPGSATFVGLGLWNSISGTLVVEVSLFIIGVAIYLRTTRPKGKAGSVALWSLIAFVVLVYIANIVLPPPPNPIAVAWGALMGWLFVPWAYWIQRTRVPR